jgi:hypothetical protein
MTTYILTTLDICTIEKLMSLITRKIITKISVESIIQARLCLKPNSMYVHPRSLISCSALL